VRLADVRPSDYWAMKSFMRFGRRVALTCGSHRIVDIRLEFCDKVCIFARDARVSFSCGEGEMNLRDPVCILLQYSHDWIGRVSSVSFVAGSAEASSGDSEDFATRKIS
jgi:hypothetical protein